jgi:hypothetical protein
MYLREDGTPYYIGKGTGRRAHTKLNHRVGLPKDPECIIVQDFESEADAFFAEKFLIALYGRKDNNTGCLRNLSDGGETPPRPPQPMLGKKHSEETKAKMRASHLGKLVSEEAKSKMSAAQTGRKHSDEHRRKVRDARLGTKRSKETCRKLSLSNTGHKASDEARKRMSESAKLRPHVRNEKGQYI